MLLTRPAYESNCAPLAVRVPTLYVACAAASSTNGATFWAAVDTGTGQERALAFLGGTGDPSALRLPPGAGAGAVPGALAPPFGQVLAGPFAVVLGWSAAEEGGACEWHAWGLRDSDGRQEWQWDTPIQAMEYRLGDGDPREPDFGNRTFLGVCGSEFSPYAAAAHGVLTVLNAATGQLVWEDRLGNEDPPPPGSTSSGATAVAGEARLVLSARSVWRFDLLSREREWRTPLLVDEELGRRLVHAGGKVYVQSGTLSPPGASAPEAATAFFSAYGASHGTLGWRRVLPMPPDSPGTNHSMFAVGEGVAALHRWDGELTVLGRTPAPIQARA